jgi:hypothetical protein
MLESYPQFYPQVGITFVLEKELNMRLWEQIVKVCRSRKFWALVAAVIAASAGYATGELSVWQWLQAVIAGLAVYSTGVALEDAGRKSA